MTHKDRLIALLERAYNLGCAASCGLPIEPADAEEVAGECGELVALLEGKFGTISEEQPDAQLLAIANLFNKE
jgi:hypothetical protein